MDYQGGKKYGELKKTQELSLDEINKLYLEDDEYQDEDEFPELTQQLVDYKKQFMSYDEDHDGVINMMELSRMMEHLDQAKTHLELKKMIAEVDREDRGAISYNDFVYMMLGKKMSVLKLILRFEEKMREKERPKGVAPKRNFDSLP